MRMASVEEAVGDVDDDARAARVLDHEAQRDETSAVENEEVARRVGLDRLDHAEHRAGRVDDLGAEQLVHEDDPVHLGGHGAQRRAAQRLGAVAVGDALEEDEVAALVGRERCTTRRPPSVSRTEPGASRSVMGDQRSTTTSPARPCAFSTRPTSNRGWRGSPLSAPLLLGSVVDDVDAGLDAVARPRHPDQGADGLGGAAAPADHAAHVLGATCRRSRTLP